MIDSWTWIEYWKGSRFSDPAAKHIEGSEIAILSTINITEVFFSVLRDYDEKQAEQKLATMKKRCFLIPPDEKIAVAAAKLKRALKMSLADSLILATARAREARVVTGDKDFKGLPDTLFIGE